MERRRVGDGLDVVLISYIDRGNCRMRLPFDEQGWDRLRKNKRRIKIWILVAAAIPRPPAGIDDKLHKIGEPSDLIGPGRLTAWQSREFTQVNRPRVDRLKVSVEE